MRILCSLAALTVLAAASVFTLSPALAETKAAPEKRPAAPFEYATPDEAWQAAQESGDPLLVAVMSDHCYYCKKLKAATLSNPQLAPELDRLFETTTINADRNPELVEQLGVQGFPTTLVVSPEGQLLARLEGFLPPSEYGKQLNSVLKAYRAEAQQATEHVAQNEAK